MDEQSLDTEKPILDAESGRSEGVTIDDDFPSSIQPEKGSRPSSMSMKQSIHELFKWNNYAVFLFTSWVLSSFMILGYFDVLYLRTLQWDFITIGAVASVVTVSSTVCRLIGGYVGDVVNRKILAVVSLLIAGLFYIVLGTFVSFEMVVLGFLFYSTLNLVKGGSSAFIISNIPKEHSGLGLSLFTAGRTFGILVLLGLGFLVPVVGFGPAMRTLYLVGGFLVIGCSVIRAAFLTGGDTKSRSNDRSLLRDFLAENLKSAKTLLRTIPLIMVVVCIDALSDSFFRFGALVYTNETLGVSYEGVIFIIMFTLLVQAPLLLITGRLSDRFGVRRASIALYSLMPVCAGLILIASYFPLWAPSSWFFAAEQFITGLGGVFTTPFLAIFIKTINDTLWWLVLLVIIRKNLPSSDASKFLGLFWVITYLVKSVGPFLASVIYAYIGPDMLFSSVLLLNLIIIGILTRIK